MVENKSSIFGIIAIIVGASGLGLGAFSVVNFQLVEGPQGIPGDDGQEGVDGMDGEDAPGGIIVGILDPDQDETISGNITIRALVAGSESYTVVVLINSSLNATYLPYEWNTTTVADGWWNVTVIVTDIITGNMGQDTVLVVVQNAIEPTYNYYCSTETEIQDAINTIGIGYGIIIITANITLSSQIDVDQGGSYIIQGAGLTIVEIGGDFSGFDISNVISCTVKDLIINSTDITTNTIPAIVINDNSVIIQNVQIFGDNTTDSDGIRINSNDVHVLDCYIYGIDDGIYLNADYCYITQNIIEESYYAIHLNTADDYNRIEQNTLTYCSVGICIDQSDNNIISDNIITYINNRTAGGYGIGIYLYLADYTIISGNIIAYDNNAVANVFGIYLRFSLKNIVSSNQIFRLEPNPGTGLSIWLSTGSDKNIVTGNNSHNNDVNTILDEGFNNELTGNNPP